MKYIFTRLITISKVSEKEIFTLKMNYSNVVVEFKSLRVFLFKEMKK